MTALMMPSFEQRLLTAVRDEVAAEPVRAWPEPTLQLCLEIVRRIRQNLARQRDDLERALANGVEARSFVGEWRPRLSAADEQIAAARGLVAQLSPMGDAASASLAAELRLLEQAAQPLRDFLAQVLARAAEPPRPVDWARLKENSDAEFAAGRFVTFETPEDVSRGLVGND